jgi:anti-anti-sigma factor
MRGPRARGRANGQHNDAVVATGAPATVRLRDERPEMPAFSSPPSLLADSVTGLPTSGPPDALEVAVRRCDDTAHVQLHGELDMATVATLETVVDRVLADGVKHVMIDLRGLEFIGSSGIALVHRLIEHDHIDLALIPGKPNIQRIFDLTGMTERVRFVQPPAHRLDAPFGD